MSDSPRRKREGNALAGQIGEKAERKLKAQRDSTDPLAFGLGMMGVIGWSVVVPTLIGAVVGHWLDERHWTNHSWTLALILAGLSIGCMNAWYWVAKESREICGGSEDANE